MSLYYCPEHLGESSIHAKILVVDSNPYHWTIVRSILEALPLSLYCVQSGDEAEVLARSIGFDLVLIDPCLGAQDGDACAVRLRSLLCGPRYAAILAFTSDPEGVGVAPVYDGTLIRPFSVLSLTEGVLLGLAAMRAARRAARFPAEAVETGAATC